METRKVTKTKPAPGRPSDVLPSAGRPTNAILTRKELNVMELVSYGYDNRAIAEHFQTTPQAVKNMMRVIHLKLGADNRAHAVAVCFRNGWFSERGNGDHGSEKPVPGPMFGGAVTQARKLRDVSVPQGRNGRGRLRSAEVRS